MRETLGHGQWQFTNLRTFSLQGGNMKYPNWKGPENEGRVDALLNILGEPNAEAVLRDELEVRFSPKPVRTFFDGNGRRIPRGLRARVCDPNPSFHLVPPVLKLQERLAHLVECFPVGTKFVSVEESEERISTLLALIQSSEQIANAGKGLYFPLCLPQIVAGDYGEILDSMFLGAMGRSYEQWFPERKFNNYRKGKIANAVKIVDESHRRLVELMTQMPVVGILTLPLQGFSVHAQREQMAGLPEMISLGGPFDITTALTAYPETLARDFHTPGLDMSAVQWQSARGSLYARARDDGLFFGDLGDLGYPSGRSSGALFFRG